MCGIAGEIVLNGRRVADLGAIRRMTDVQESRGPDGSGDWTDGTVALGHRRLEIIDLTESGAQPMTDVGGQATIVFNGCIYNYRELRADLERRGRRFRSHSDTEVLLAAYLEWGDEFVHRLNGMFAFCIRDERRRRTLLGRDRLGIKPLYLSTVAGALRFASSLPALLAGGGVDTSIDGAALHNYLTFHSVVPAPRTILSGVRRLPPATLLTVEQDGTTRERVYWEPSFDRAPDRSQWSDDDWREAILESLRTSVMRRLVADVRVGVLLSGGLDSSLVVGLLAEAGATELATFSIGFETVRDVEGDEFRYSDVIARRFETDHTRISVPTAELVPSLRAAIGAMSEPMVSHDVVAFHLLSREVSKHVKVVQSGQGADEVFAGYRWYPPLAELGDPSVDAATAAYADVFFDRDDDALRALVQPEHRVGRDESREFVAQHFGSAGATAAIDRALRLDTRVMLVDDPVKRVDNMTMAWGLEARVPFLDHELVELAATCPPRLKLNQGGKGVLKDAARSVIPHEVIDRPKGYFPVPALTYLDGEVLEMVTDALHAPEAKERGLFEPDALERLLADPNDALTPLRGNQLWQLGLLELWLQRHVG